MSIPSEEPNAIESKSDVDMAKFDLDKTYVAWYECHKKLASSLFIFFVFTGTLAVSVSVDAPEEGFKIPVVGVSLQKWRAVEILSIMQALSLLQFIAISKYMNLLSLKLEHVLSGVGDYRRCWHWRHPSIFSILVYSKIRKGFTGVRFVLVAFFMFGGGLPLYCLLVVYNEVSFTIEWSIILGIYGVLYFTSMYISRSKDADKLSLERLDSTES